ncbi:hypothetical protein PJP07_30840, partial [Mycobacterium kansasii]
KGSSKVGKISNLSMGGRVMLIKAAMSNLPVYLMSLLHCPKLVLDKLEKLTRDFLWQGASDNHKFHLMKGVDVCKPRDEGGTSLR